MIKHLKSDLRDFLKTHVVQFAKLAGVELLTKNQTEAYLRPFQIAASEENLITLPEIVNLTDRTTVLFNQASVVPNQGRVWQYEQNGAKATLLPNGSIRIGRKVLDTDFGTNGHFKELFKRRKKTSYTVDTLIAPWSHTWGAYYDYLFFVAAKVCRIKAALPDTIFRESLIAYPLKNTSFERELLTLLGIDLSKVVDSRNSAVNFSQCVIGNNNSWFFPDPADVSLLREQLLSGMTPQKGPGNRIYIRRSGRRRIVNEDALIALLTKYNIDIIDDQPRSVAEQFAIYNGASFIIGPHGASFANLLWCKPGTQLVELFAENYVLEYYRYLAHLIGVRYSAYCHGRFDKIRYANVDTDVFVSVEQLERSLDKLFERQPTL